MKLYFGYESYVYSKRQMEILNYKYIVAVISIKDLVIIFIELLHHFHQIISIHITTSV